MRTSPISLPRPAAGRDQQEVAAGVRSVCLWVVKLEANRALTLTLSDKLDDSMR